MEIFDGAELVRRVLDASGNRCEPLLALAEGRETNWLEFKAAFHPSGEHKLGPKETLGDWKWHVVKAVASIANTHGGAVLLGVDDVKGTPVGLAGCGWEGRDPEYQRKVLDNLFPQPPRWELHKGTIHQLNGNLMEQVETRLATLHGTEVLVVLVRAGDGNAFRFFQTHGHPPEFVPVRVIGQVGRELRLDASPADSTRRVPPGTTYATLWARATRELGLSLPVPLMPGANIYPQTAQSRLTEPDRVRRFLGRHGFEVDALGRIPTIRMRRDEELHGGSETCTSRRAETLLQLLLDEPTGETFPGELDRVLWRRLDDLGADLGHLNRYKSAVDLRQEVTAWLGHRAAAQDIGAGDHSTRLVEHLLSRPSLLASRDRFEAWLRVEGTVPAAVRRVPVIRVVTSVDPREGVLRVGSVELLEPTNSVLQGMLDDMLAKLHEQGSTDLSIAVEGVLDALTEADGKGIHNEKWQFVLLVRAPAEQCHQPLHLTLISKRIELMYRFRAVALQPADTKPGRAIEQCIRHPSHPKSRTAWVASGGTHQIRRTFGRWDVVLVGGEVALDPLLRSEAIRQFHETSLAVIAPVASPDVLFPGGEDGELQVGAILESAGELQRDAPGPKQAHPIVLWNDASYEPHHPRVTP